MRITKNADALMARNMPAVKRAFGELARSGAQSVVRESFGQLDQFAANVGLLNLREGAIELKTLS